MSGRDPGDVNRTQLNRHNGEKNMLCDTNPAWQLSVHTAHVAKGSLKKPRKPTTNTPSN
eukprot:m.1205252 g.1205252  ORF g.1205252 m.1205252 type:complete len:59 (-) comp24582_c0_seq18:3561-3737(-)